MGLFGWLETKAEGKVIQNDVDDALKENPNMWNWLKNHKGPLGAVAALIAAGLQLCGDPTCSKASVFFGLLTVALVHAGVFNSDQEARVADLVGLIRPHLPAIEAAAPEAKALLDIILAAVKAPAVKKAAIVLLALALAGTGWAMQQWTTQGTQTSTSVATSSAMSRARRGR